MGLEADGESDMERFGLWVVGCGPQWPARRLPVGVPVAPAGALDRASNCRVPVPVFLVRKERKGRKEGKSVLVCKSSPCAAYPAMDWLYFASFASFADKCLLFHILES